MNETLRTILDRRSVKSYTGVMPPEDLIMQVAEAGTWAASGLGKQSPVILAVTDRGLRDRLSRLNAAVMGVESDPFYGAPAVLVVLADRTVPTYVYDGSLVMGNMMIAASSLGLGSCWIHRAKEVFEGAEGRKILDDAGMEGDLEGIGNLVLGYAAGRRPALPRKKGYITFIR